MSFRNKEKKCEEDRKIIEELLPFLSKKRVENDIY